MIAEIAQEAAHLEIPAHQQYGHDDRVDEEFRRLLKVIQRLAVIKASWLKEQQQPPCSNGAPATLTHFSAACNDDQGRSGGCTFCPVSVKNEFFLFYLDIGLQRTFSKSRKRFHSYCKKKEKKRRQVKGPRPNGRANIKSSPHFAKLQIWNINRARGRRRPRSDRERDFLLGTTCQPGSSRFQSPWRYITGRKTGPNIFPFLK